MENTLYSVMFQRYGKHTVFGYVYILVSGQAIFIVVIIACMSPYCWTLIVYALSLSAYIYCKTINKVIIILYIVYCARA